MSGKQEIEQILRAINEAWTQGKPEDLGRYFHPDMVIVGPDGQPAGRGSEACISSYRSFAQSAKIHSFSQAGFQIEVFENTSAATYSFSLSYEIDGQVFKDSGRDMFVFSREREGWKAVWRMILPPGPDKSPA
jgi:ketosteroid isomerase-like protein